jgi:germination protein M
MKKILLLIMIFITVLSLSACGSKKQPVSSLIYTAENASEIAEKTPLFLYFSNAEKTMLCLEVRYVPNAEYEELEPARKVEYVVNELLKGPSANTGLLSFIPPGTSLRSPVVVVEGCAQIDFNSEFKNTKSNNIAEEKIILYSVVNSVTEVEKVDTVLFKIDGKLEENYLGNFKFNVPFPRNESLIYNSVDN